MQQVKILNELSKLSAYSVFEGYFTRNLICWLGLK